MRPFVCIHRIWFRGANVGLGGRSVAVMDVTDQAATVRRHCSSGASFQDGVCVARIDSVTMETAAGEVLISVVGPAGPVVHQLFAGEALVREGRVFQKRSMDGARWRRRSEKPHVQRATRVVRDALRQSQSKSEWF